MIIRSLNKREEELKRKVGQALEADRLRLLLKHPFIGFILMRMDLIPTCDHRLETACTDGSRIFVDVRYYTKMAKKYRPSLLAHEVWHVVYAHFLRKGNRSDIRWNIAADLEIHFMLESEKLPEQDVLDHDPAWKGLSAEMIYEKLPQVPEQKAFTGHIYPGPGNGTEPQTESPEDQTELVVDADYAPFFVSGLKDRCKELVVSAVQQAKKQGRGDLPGGIERLVEEYLNPKIGWRELLRQFICSCFNGERCWLPPNRRYVSQGLYLQSRRGERLGKIVVAMDTSGSMQDCIPMIFGELTALLKTFAEYEITVIQCDAEIQNVQIFNEENPYNDSRKWKMSGSGGTVFTPVFEYVREQAIDPMALLFLTDGDGSISGELERNLPSYPVLWFLTGGKDVPVCWGTRIEIPKD